ncbi:hypothetical protein GVAV_002942 [Gurleya vavrai]
MTDNENFNLQLEDEVLLKLRNDYHIRKAVFEEKQYSMNIDQIQINNLLIKIEANKYFEYLYRNETALEAGKRREKEFMRMFTCCNRGFETFREFEIHKKTVHNEGQEDDAEADESTLSGEYRFVPLSPPQSDEVSYSNEAEKIRNHKCTVEGCKKSYTSAYGLRYHLEKGHLDEVKGTKPFKCNVENCNKRYKNMNGLKYHLSRGHIKI